MKIRRLISLLLTVAILLTCFTVTFASISASADDKSYIIGDADTNDVVSINDASLVQLKLAQKKDISALGMIAADVNLDEKVTIIDASLIQQYLVNKITESNHTGEVVEPTEPTVPTETEEEPTETEPVPTETEPEPTINPDVPLSDTVNDGTILQAFCWSFSTIETNLQAVKDAGFTTIQVSPPNEIKEGTKNAKMVQDDNKNGWWMFYQPAGFQLNESTDNALGTKSEFVSMCNKAHQLGIKVIVDAVINHMGTCDNEESVTSTNPMDHVTPKAKQFEPEIYNGKLFHSPWAAMTYKEDPNQFSQYDSTYDLTRNCTSRLPDLDTSNTIVQNVIYDYLDELIEAGADGFRFDAAKHIETESDIQGLRSDFWNNTLEKIRTKYKGKVECYAYGEILNTCGVNRPYSMYTKHFDVTDSSSIWAISNAVRGYGGNACPSLPNSNFTKENCVLWDESHDTYVDGSTTSYSVDVRNRIWAITAGRADVTCVYLARPDDSTSTSPMKNITIGSGAKTSWANEVTAQINKFHNRHIGDGEYCTANSGNRAYIERGDSGCIIVGLSSTKGGSVSLTNHKLKKGIYVDQLTGNQFTVSANSSGKISGNIGSSGIAILEFLKDEGGSIDPTQPTSPTSGPDTPYPKQDGCYTVVISNSMGWNNFFFYCWNDSQQALTAWPGDQMIYCKTNEFGQNQYCCFVPYDYTNFIVNNGDGVQTDDGVITQDTGIYLGDKDPATGRYELCFWDISNY